MRIRALDTLVLMNYYERHIGDYAKSAGHLSMLEHGAYTLLLDRYYSTERGIPVDQVYRVGRASTKQEKAAVDTVLSEFFTLEGGIWIKNRVEEEIASAHVRIEAARANGKTGGRPKKNPVGIQTQTQQKPTGFHLGNPELTQSKALQSPISSLQSPVRDKTKSALADARAVAGLDVEQFDRWIGYRADRKPAIKPASLKAAAEELAAFGAQQAIVVQHSIANGYQGLFAPKPNGQHQRAPPLKLKTADEIEAEERARGDWDAQH